MSRLRANSKRTAPHRITSRLQPSSKQRTTCHSSASPHLSPTHCNTSLGFRPSHRTTRHSTPRLHRRTEQRNPPQGTATLGFTAGQATPSHFSASRQNSPRHAMTRLHFQSLQCNSHQFKPRLHGRSGHRISTQFMSRLLYLANREGVPAPALRPLLAKTMDSAILKNRVENFLGDDAVAENIQLELQGRFL